LYGIIPDFLHVRPAQHLIGEPAAQGTGLLSVRLVSRNPELTQAGVGYLLFLSKHRSAVSSNRSSALSLYMDCGFLGRHLFHGGDPDCLHVSFGQQRPGMQGTGLSSVRSVPSNPKFTEAGDGYSLFLSKHSGAFTPSRSSALSPYIDC
jgi:hypothetical protein